MAGLDRGVAGAAEATVISQYVSGIGIAVYTRIKFPDLIKRDGRRTLRLSRVREITNFSALTCLQQSIMNLGILAVQGLVNSYGTTVMAAFAGSGKDRCVCVSSGSGFRKCVFDICSAEFRRKKDRTN